MQKYTVTLLLSLVVLLPSPPALAGPTFNYLRALIHSLEAVKSTQSLVNELSYQNTKPSEIVKAKLVLQKGIKQINKAKVDLEKFKNTDDKWVIASIRYIQKGYDRMAKVYKEVIRLLDKRLNRTYLDREEIFHTYVERKLIKLGNVADYFHNGVTIATYSIVDSTEVSDFGPTHLLITPQEFKVLKEMLELHFPPDVDLVIVKSKQPATTALLVLNRFLGQEWKFTGSTVSVAGATYKPELFNDDQLDDMSYRQY